MLKKILPEKYAHNIDKIKFFFNSQYENIFFFWQEKAFTFDKDEMERITKKTKKDFIKIIMATFTINIFSLAMPIMMLQTYDRIIPNKGIPTLSLLSAGLILFVGLEVILKIIRSHIASLTSSVFEHFTSCEAIKNLMNADYEDIESTGSGIFLKRMQAITRLRSFYSGQTLMSIVDLPFTFIYLVVIWHIGHSLVFVPIAICLLYTIFVIKKGNILKKITEERDETNNTKGENLVQVLDGIHAVKSLGAEQFFIRKNQNIRARQSEVYFKIGETNNIINNIGSSFSQLMTISVVIFGSILVYHGVFGMGGLAATVMLSGRLMQPIQKILGLWTRFQDFDIAQKEVRQLFDFNISKKYPLPEDWEFHGNYIVKNLGYSIQEDVVEKDQKGKEIRNIDIVKDLNLDLKTGECIAIHEQHGLGKTTLMHLLSGFYKPHRGAVYLDYFDISTIPYHQLYKHISYISERGEILRGTIKENMTFFGLIPWEEAEHAAELFGINEAVAVLSQGWETVLYNSPADLIPPGLKQRICIARTLALKPKIVFFDNADVSLDMEGYRRMFNILGKIKKNVITIMVTQDRNFMELADREYRFLNGELILYDEKKKVELIA